MSALRSNELTMDFGIDEIGEERRLLLISMLDNTTYDEKQKEIMRYAINRLEWMHQFNFVIKRIEMNTIQDKDRIAMGLNYNQSDIKKRLKGDGNK